jgi:hypothetical protein
MFNKINFNEILSSLGVICVCVLLFGGGFYFGAKSSKVKLKEELSKQEKIQSLAISESSLEKSNIKVEASSVGEPVAGAYWIKVGQAPICPETHPIKGKFDSKVNIYYTPDYPKYDKIKPEICLSDEAFAKDIAGFIKKY